MLRPKLSIDPNPEARPNRFVEVLHVAAQKKTEMVELTRASLAEEFRRENPMPWLLDSDPIEDPTERKTA